NLPGLVLGPGLAEKPPDLVLTRGKHDRSDAKQVDFEQQGCIGRDHPTSATGSVAQLRRDDQGAGAAHLHALNAFVPAADHMASAEGKLERIVAVLAGVELGTLDATF